MITHQDTPFESVPRFEPGAQGMFPNSLAVVRIDEKCFPSYWFIQLLHKAAYKEIFFNLKLIKFTKIELFLHFSYPVIFRCYRQLCTKIPQKCETSCLSKLEFKEGICPQELLKKWLDESGDDTPKYFSLATASK